MKNLINFLLAAVMILICAGCAASTKKENDPAAQTENEDSVTLTVWYYTHSNSNEGYDIWAEQVKDAYPYISLEFEALPYDSGPEKYTISLATGANPDIYFDTYSRCAQAIGAGMTLDLSELREQYADKFLGPQTDGIIDGRYQAIVTHSGTAYCLFVNMTMVEDAGLEDMLPEDHLTWSYDEYLAFLRALRKAYPDVYPMELFAGSQSSDMWYYSWLLGNGVKLTNENLTATTFNTGDNREKALQTLNLLKTVIDEGLCNPGSATMSDEEAGALFSAGRSAIRHGAYSNVVDWYTNSVMAGNWAMSDFDVFAMPTYEGAEVPLSGSFGAYSLIAFDSHNEAKNDAIRKALAVYMENPECQTIVTNATGRLSTMTDTVVEYMDQRIVDMMEIGASYSASHTDSSFGVLEDWWTEFRGTFYPNLQDFYVGNIDAGELLDKWQSAGDAVIAAFNVQ